MADAVGKEPIETPHLPCFVYTATGMPKDIMADTKREWKPLPTTPGFWWMQSRYNTIQPVQVLAVSRHTATFVNDNEFILITIGGQKGFYLRELRQMEQNLNSGESTFQFQKIKPAD